MSPRYGIPDDENPEWTDEMIANARPAAEVLPRAIVAAHTAERRHRGKQKTPTKTMISMRVDPKVLAAYKRGGKGWQVRMNQTLAKYAPRLRKATPATRPRARKR